MAVKSNPASDLTTVKIILGGALAVALLVTPYSYGDASAAQSNETDRVTTSSVNDVPEPLDPTTFSGEVSIATEAGDVIVSVDSGELVDVAEDIRALVAEGLSPIDAVSRSDFEIQALPFCQRWKNATGGRNTWVTSGDGCAVFGYDGYRRIYNWANVSSVSGCARALGFNGTSTQYYSMGCVGSGGQSSLSVPWGNVLMHTKTQGMSISVTTGMAYQWQY